MRRELAFYARFVSTGTAGRIAPIGCRRRIDAYRIALAIVIAACAFDTDWTNLAATCDVAHDRHAAARRRRRARRTARNIAASAAAISATARAATGCACAKPQFVESSDELTTKRARAGEPCQTREKYAGRRSLERRSIGVRGRHANHSTLTGGRRSIRSCLTKHQSNDGDDGGIILNGTLETQRVVIGAAGAAGVFATSFRTSFVDGAATRFRMEELA